MLLIYCLITEVTVTCDSVYGERRTLKYTFQEKSFLWSLCWCHVTDVLTSMKSEFYSWTTSPDGWRSSLFVFSIFQSRSRKKFLLLTFNWFLNKVTGFEKAVDEVKGHWAPESDRNLWSPDTVTEGHCEHMTMSRCVTAVSKRLDDPDPMWTDPPTIRERTWAITWESSWDSPAHHCPRLAVSPSLVTCTEVCFLIWFLIWNLLLLIVTLTNVSPWKHWNFKKSWDFPGAKLRPPGALRKSKQTLARRLEESRDISFLTES